MNIKPISRELITKSVPVEKTPARRIKRIFMNRFMRPVRSLLTDLDPSIYETSLYKELLEENVENGFRDTYPDFLIDFPKVVLMRGELCCSNMSVRLNKRNQYELSWMAVTGMDGAQRNDLLFIALFYQESQYWHLIADAAYRSDRRLELDAKLFRSGSAHLYAGFISEDRERISDIRYV